MELFIPEMSESILTHIADVGNLKSRFSFPKTVEVEDKKKFKLLCLRSFYDHNDCIPILFILPLMWIFIQQYYLENECMPRYFICFKMLKVFFV